MMFHLLHLLPLLLASIPPTTAPANAAQIATPTEVFVHAISSFLARFIPPTAETIAIIAGELDDLENGHIGELIEELELEYSYGRSPPVYPSPLASGQGAWADAYLQARALVAQMTNEEKNEVLIGEGLGARGCSTYSKDLARLGFTGLCFQDAESGVRTGQFVNGYAAQLSVGASWNRELTYSRGKFIGAEFKAKGANVLLGPVVGPLGRVARGGRNWEGFSNDPYLVGALVHPTIRGMQESVIACVKHLVGNEQETHRLPFSAGLVKPPLRANQSLSSNMDDRTMHELYLWPFYDAVRAGAGSVMTAYTKVNGSDSSANSKVLNGLLKTELGFQGFVISDWYGQHTGVASAKAGLDVALPSSVYWNNHQLSTAAMNGTLETARLDDMVVRMLAAWYRYAKLETPGMALNVAVDARDPAAEDTIFQGAVEGHVLVKNINNALPLSKPRSLGIYGFDAANSAFTDKRSFKYPLSMLNTHTFPDGTPFADINCALLFTTIAKAGTVGPDVALNGTLITGGGSGGCSPDTTIAPYDAFLSQSKVDGTTLHTDFWSFNPVVDPTTDAAIVFVNEQASEAWDRVSLASPYADELIKSVAAQHHNTIVVIHNAGIRLVDRWYDNPNITAVIYGHLPGQASGSAITEIMYGRQSPSGRLPYTVGKSEADYGDLLSPTVATASNPYYAQSDFVEGLHIDYKAFIKAGITPRFPFGFGLTYTTFAYSSLHIARNAAANSSPFPPDAADSSATVAPEGGLDSLYDTLLTITATITNIGHLHAAAEVAQLYLGIPDSGVEKVLRGFDKVMIQPGETAEVQFPLRRRDVSVWDVAAQQWRIPAGTFRVYVGKDVLDEDMLTGSFELIAEDSPLRNAAGLQGEQVPL